MRTPYFRLATLDDCRLIADWISNPLLNVTLSSNLRRAKIAKEAIALGLRRRDQSWMVFSTGASKPLLGLVAIDSIDAIDRTANVWFLMGESQLFGQGITSSALAYFCETNPIGLHTVTAWAIEDNLASLRCMEKAGFTYAGRISEAVFSDGSWRDRILMQRRMGC